MEATFVPDPRRGVFETLLVLAGTPVELPAHLRRLDASLEDLFGAGLPAEAPELIRRGAAGLELGRLRLSVAPLAGGLACEVAAAEIDPTILFPAPEQGADLSGQPLAGGLGAHKWVDRGPIERSGDGAVPLLFDRGGEVLEAGWGNVFAVFDGALYTPTDDGRILPGTVRARTIEIAEAEDLEVFEGRLEIDRLPAAEEVFLTGSVRGVEAARSLDGVELGAAGEVSRLVGASLRRRWRLDAVPEAGPVPAAGP